MTIGFDIDGCLANFNREFIYRTIETTGRDLFLPSDEGNPPVWDYPEHRGYTREEVRAVWKSIVRDEEFWLNLPRLPGVCDLELVIQAIQDFHTVCFITSRDGKDVMAQTEKWLMLHLGLAQPPDVYITKSKGRVAKALSLDTYIDDKWENVLDICEQSPQTRTYLLNYAYNYADDMQFQQYGYRRVDSVQEMLNLELPNL